MNTLAAVDATPGLAAYMAELEVRLAQAVGRRSGFAAEVAGEALVAGGKRLRPLLCFLSSPSGETDPPLAAGVATELVHMATLVHDDLVDGARMRRGMPSAWSVFGPGAALSAGDYLFACAFAELAATDDSAAVAELADACLALARGEAMQRRQTRKPETSIDDYLERCALKTGKLFEAACRLGSGGDARLGAYGLALGIAFQIADDILDCAGQTQETGKIPGSDLREGTPTMPLLLAAQQDEVVRRALAGGPLDGALVRVAETDALARSREAALAYAAKARGCIGAAAYREELEALTYAVVDPGLLMAIAVDRTLELVRDKVEAGERLDLEDGLALMESDDLLAVGELADLARRARGGDDRVFFVQNVYLNQTNVCRVKCKFCAFAATRKQAHAYTVSADDLVADALALREEIPFTEIHMVNGENPYIGFDVYLDTIGKLHDALPDVFLKCYTASEIHHMTTLSGLTHEQVLRELQEVGLGALTGGGAEVFADRVRRLVAPGKEHPDIWFHVHDTAHRLGIPTHCTLLYGHVETYEERVEHLLRLREQQDRTGGFLAFIPLAFHPKNTVFERRGFTFQTGAADLKMLAVSRLLLDNIQNIKAYWISLTLPVAQVALHFGANDVQGTLVREEIFRAAGSTTGTEQKLEELVRTVRAAGRVPVQRDTLYNELRRWDP